MKRSREQYKEKSEGERGCKFFLITVSYCLSHYFFILHRIKQGNVAVILLSELRGHLLAEDPVGHGGAGDDLCTQELVAQHHHHLLVRRPHLVHLLQHQDLRFLVAAHQTLKHLANNDTKEQEIVTTHDTKERR